MKHNEAQALLGDVRVTVTLSRFEASLLLDMLNAHASEGPVTVTTNAAGVRCARVLQHIVRAAIRAAGRQS